MKVAFYEPESLVTRKEPQRKLCTFKEMQQAIKKLRVGVFLRPNTLITAFPSK